MSKLKFTTNELRAQQYRLGQLNRYLPTLQLKKAMLQAEIHEVRGVIGKLQEKYEQRRQECDGYAKLLTDKGMINPKYVVEIEALNRGWENIAGIDVPFFRGVKFKPIDYNLFDTHIWMEGVIEKMQGLISAKMEIVVMEEKKAILEEELRQVSIRVNLFEKVLIPRAERNIKRIKVFLGDHQLAAVGQVKVAKQKIEERKQKKLCESM